MAKQDLINLLYLLASVLFILGLKGLARPRTAVRGNALGAVGMLLAIVVTLFDKNILGFEMILGGVAVGAVVGAWLALRIEMTAMPQLVALFNGAGGGASALVAAAEFQKVSVNALAGTGAPPDATLALATGASMLIGAVTFSGSFIAFAKLQGIMSGKPIQLPGHHVLNGLLALGALALCGLIVAQAPATMGLWILAGVALVFGVTIVIPIGGADMPVIIALLNAMSGLAAAATGFVLLNDGLIVAGSLVGASGLILTGIMCKAMNRSLANVMFAGVGGATGGPSGDELYEGRIKATSADELAMILEDVTRVMIVPGYGLAVAQAQHAVRDLTNLLGERNVEVTFGIHPVAGRMPGHMNVLLAEVDIPYELLYDLDEANSVLEQTDVVIIIGANDVVNPLARTDSNSPIYGMPILDVDKARTAVVIKRSLSPGFAGIPNPLFAADRTLMYFGDAKKALTGLITALKEA